MFEYKKLYNDTEDDEMNLDVKDCWLPKTFNDDITLKI